MSRHGAFYRISDAKHLQRWRCKECRSTISLATGTACFAQKKRRINSALRFLLGSGMSQRRTARFFKVHPITIARRVRFFSQQNQLRHLRYFHNFAHIPLEDIQIDEMETFEHTKLKPLSIALAVHVKTRKILGVRVSEMPANGLLAAKSRAKYGQRPDGRGEAMENLLHDIAPFVSPEARVSTDENPKYPGWFRRYPHRWNHQRYKGRRGCVVGQGELKKIGFDPLFSLNHTCAMIRDNVSRLKRRTWCTTKKLERLVDHLWIYIDMHNRMLT